MKCLGAIVWSICFASLAAAPFAPALLPTPAPNVVAPSLQAPDPMGRLEAQAASLPEPEGRDAVAEIPDLSGTASSPNRTWAGRTGIQDPLLRLTHVLSTESEVSDIIRGYRAYYHELGFNVPAGDPRTFDGNSSIAYTYPMDDVNLDGTDDVAVEQFCVDAETCPTGGNAFVFPPDLSVVYDLTCTPYHRISGLSGADGVALWQWDFPLRDMERVLAISSVALAVGCLEFVVGSVPTENGPALLVYRLWVIHPCLRFFCVPSEPVILKHDYYAIDHGGRLLWNLTVVGHYTYAFASTPEVINFSRAIHGENVTVLPVIQGVSRRGTPTPSNGSRPALFLRGIGFDDDSIDTNTWICPDIVCPTFLYPQHVVPPGMSHTPHVMNSYQPNEWAGRVDTTKGTFDWKRTTFHPNPGGPRSMFPQWADFAQFCWNSLQFYERPVPWDYYKACHAPPVFWWVGTDWLWDAGQYAFRSGERGESYWYDNRPCCEDLTGDGIPDLVYVVTEWNAFPSTKLDAPDAYDTRLVLFDGATGAKRYDFYLAREEREYTPWSLQPSGDLDGDGVADFLIHGYKSRQDEWQTLSARKGSTGAELWSRNSSRLSITVPLGGPPGRPGDVLIAEVYPRIWDLLNVSAVDFVVLRGNNGTTGWTTTTFSAFIDLNYMFGALQENGWPDLNHDGEGDVVIDDPVLLGDLTYVHRLSFLDGHTGSPLNRIIVPGQVAFPALAADLDVDGNEDICILNGDIIDLWITCYPGYESEAAWSRRAFVPQVAGYVLMIPRIHFDTLRTWNQTRNRFEQDLLMNSHIGLYTAGDRDPGRWTLATLSQMLAIDREDGALRWALPEVADNITAGNYVGDDLEAQAYLRQFEGPPPSDAARWTAGAAKVGMTGLAVAAPFLALFLLTSRAGRRWGR